MRKIIRFLVLVLVCFLSACIESDESTSLYLANDGRVEMVMVLDRVLSTAQEPERTKEQTKWLAEFKSGSLNQLKKLRDLKAKNVRAVLLRQEPPYAAVIRGTLDSIDSLGKFFDLNVKPDGDRLRFISARGIRKISIEISGKETKETSPAPAAGAGAPRYPVFKFIPVDGKITETVGCTPDKDQRACFLDFAWIDQMEREGKGYTIVIGWNATTGK